MNGRALAAFTLTASLIPWSASAEPTSLSAGDEVLENLSIRETKFRVVSHEEAKDALATPPNLDEPVSANLPLLETKRETEGRAHLDPFFGRTIYPEISAGFTSAFVRETYQGDSANDGAPAGNMALASRVALSLWFLDLRFPISTSRADEPSELSLKIPFALGDGAHRLAPIFSAHVPMNAGFSHAIYEAGLGYHGAFGRFALKLEVSAWNGSFDRTEGAVSGGKLGYNAVASFLATDNFGLIVELDGATSISERSGESLPQSGDTVLRFYPGIRFYPSDDARLYLGAAAIFSVVPDEYDLLRRRGALLELGYTFL
jgi:hypothetical protein